MGAGDVRIQRAAADPRAPGGDPAGARRPRCRLPGRAGRAGSPAADRGADAARAPRVRKHGAARVRSPRAARVKKPDMNSRSAVRLETHNAARGRLFAATSIGAALAAAALLLRRRIGPLRLRRGLAALQLVARGGARYAGSAPRLFAAARGDRQRPPHDLALHTPAGVAPTLGALEGVLVKLGHMAR